MTRATILESIRRSGTLPAAYGPVTCRERNALVMKLMREGKIAYTNGRWFFRGEPAQWGTRAPEGYRPRAMVSPKQLDMFAAPEAVQP